VKGAGRRPAWRFVTAMPVRHDAYRRPRISRRPALDYAQHEGTAGSHLSVVTRAVDPSPRLIRAPQSVMKDLANILHNGLWFLAPYMYSRALPGGQLTWRRLAPVTYLVTGWQSLPSFV
jgi:hypothetical protein